MLKLASYDIVFQEIPGEVTLALNLAGCPNRCRGCHSPHLQEDAGEPLDDELFSGLLRRYGDAVTCVCFMGGDGSPDQIQRLAAIVRETTGLKTGWYSGREAVPPGFAIASFDYIKLGPYVEAAGGLDSPTTNQRFYGVTEGGLTDLTHMFRK